MKKLLLTMVTCVGFIASQAQGVYQIPNSDFEEWAAENEPGNGWNSFASAGGTWSSFASSSPAPQKTAGYESDYAVLIRSARVIIANANGNLTTGRVNMGSMTPANAANYNFTDTTATTHSLLFAGTPDAVSFYAKFKSGGSENGRGQFILHDEYEYRDPETSNDEGYEDHKIAMAAILVPETEEWTYFEAPFEYTGVATPEKQYMLASLTTNPTPGGSANDTLIVDCIRIIYYSELDTLTYNGEDILVEGQTAYDLSDKTYDESLLACTSNGRAATIEQSYDEGTGLLTITVKGNDWSEENLNQHTYTLQFSTAKQITEYTNSLLVGLNGSYSAPTEQTILLMEEADGSYSFFLGDFSFSGIAVGDIKMTNLERTEEGNTVTYEQTQNLSLAEGQLNVTATLKATEENGLLTATISIPDVYGTLDVDVTFAPSLVIDNNTDISLPSDGLYNVTFSRSFPAGWSTICLPYATTAETIGAAEVQAFTDYTEQDGQNALQFEKVESGEMEAHTPYLIRFEEATDSTASYFPMDNITAADPGTVTHGFISFTGNYTAGMDMEGLYGMTEEDDICYIVRREADNTLGSSEAYFTVSDGTADSQLRIFLDGETVTGVAGITAEDSNTPFDIYTLSGIKVRGKATDTNGLPQGIYIINGKKYVVK